MEKKGGLKYIDLRSDTVTKPSPAMLDAMMRAEVGDDVYGEDPTVNELQDRIKGMFGKEAALFVPSGTMGNEIAIKVHTQPGDEIIVEENSHILVYETGAPALLSGVQLHSLPGNNGCFTPDQILHAIRPSAYYFPKTALICLENTHGRSGGAVLPIEVIRAIRAIALAHRIPMHLDGARLWNASVASGVSLETYAAQFESVSVCFSKGLGAPVGSILVGSRDFIERARKYRKIFGGGMRQAGVLAAAAIYAIENNIGRLKEDHEKAKYFANELRMLKNVKLDPDNIQTNMVFAEIKFRNMTQSEMLNLLKSHGLLLTPEGTSSVRAVMHLDVSMDEVKTAVTVMKSLFK